VTISAESTISLPTWRSTGGHDNASLAKGAFCGRRFTHPRCPPEFLGEGEEDEAIADLDSAFSLYFDEISHCRAAGNYLALLHLLVSLPDVCAALQDDNGRTSNVRYQAWCRYFGTDPRFTPED